jgi:hypothetical protein
MITLFAGGRCSGTSYLYATEFFLPPGIDVRPPATRRPRMSTHPPSTTDRTAATDRTTPTLTDGKWRDETRDPDPFDLDAPVQFAPFSERRLHNLFDAENLAMPGARAEADARTAPQASD